MTGRQVTRRGALVGAAGVAGALAGCSGDGGSGEGGTPTRTPADGLALASPAFDDGAAIPSRYARADENVNPPLTVGGVPDDAAALALLFEDPDAPGGTFAHWLVWGIPPDVGGIPAGWSPPDGVRQGTNDFGTVGYEGPAPPEEHTYRFRLFAVGEPPELERGAERAAFLSAVEPTTLARATLRGTYAPEG